MMQTTGEQLQIELRFESNPSDREALRELLLSTGFFYAHEIDVAIELLDDRLSKGEKSEYYFIFADVGGKMAGYVCYGPITVTEHRFDMYWIGVHQAWRGRGIGGQLLKAAEDRMRALNGAYVYVETSSRPLYEPTRKFYEKNGYPLVARIPHFYADDDDRMVYMKALR
jgi:ribosomal protein S18 acetylase RimI-like enzyme